MKTHTGFGFVACCLIFNASLLLVHCDSACAQNLVASANTTASFRVRSVVVLPDDGGSNSKGIRYTQVSSDDHQSLFAPSDLLAATENASSSDENVTRASVLPAISTKGKHLIVFVNN